MKSHVGCIAIFFFLLLIAGCKAISERKEIAIGQQASVEVESLYPVSYSSSYQERVSRIGGELIQYAHRKVPYSFKVVNAKEENAFALPGGPIYVTTGLMRMNLTDDQLAAVLAHEITHIEKRHFVRMRNRMENHELLRIPLAVFGGDVGYSIARYSSLVQDLIVNPRWSRGDEYEADRGAVSLMHETGRDPHTLNELFDAWSKDVGKSPRGLARWVATHPGFNRRIRAVNAEIAALPPTSNTRPATPVLRPLARAGDVVVEQETKTGLIHASWRGDGRKVKQVDFVLLKAGGSVIANRTTTVPPYEWNLNPPPVDENGMKGSLRITVEFTDGVRTSTDVPLPNASTQTSASH